jgi:endonuclease G
MSPFPRFSRGYRLLSAAALALLFCARLYAPASNASPSAQDAGATLQSASCDAQSPGAPPRMKPALEMAATLVCYDGYVAKFSAIAKTPLWSAERLYPSRIAAARSLLRVDVFHPEPSLAPGKRSELSDYRGSGFDRGHMSPNGDMPTPEAAAQSFSLANIVPQNAHNNRYLWADIETAVRDLAREGDVYVVTGPLFIGAELKTIGARVFVPTHLFKAVYAPTLGAQGVYVTPNDDSGALETLSLSAFAARYGETPFPDAAPAAIDAEPRLPQPRARRGHRE